MEKRFQEGFTLIEMLVVVAVIGLLSSVILTALGPAKDKAKDTRIISNVNQIRSLAETLYDGDYDALPTLPGATGNQNIQELAEDVLNQGGELTTIKPLSGSARAYSVYSKLNTTVGDSSNPQIQYYCVDSAGHSVTTTAEPGATVCPVQ
jgi:prepilin-type N-terminal cleavage/methylation domain-containing protein